MKKILLLSILISSLSLVACGGTPEQKNTDPKLKVVDNGLSDYQLVLTSQSASLYTITAANEFNYYLSLATGASLKIVYEDENSFNNNLPFISIGNTSLVSEYNIPIPDVDLGNSGYIISSKDGNYFILDGGSEVGLEGLLYGAYDLLGELIKLRIYAEDEAYYTTDKTVYYKDINMMYTPTFDTREISYRELISSRTYSNRMRLINGYVDSRWGCHGHTLCTNDYRIIESSKYYALHPEWYASNGDQLCYTAHGDETSYKELVNTVSYNLYHNYIIEKPESLYFQFGQNDNHNFCSCDACKAKSIEYTGVSNSISGLQTLFVNDCINRIYEMMEEENDQTNINRDIRFVVFGYQETIVPFEGNKIIPHEKLWFEFTPIEANFAFDFSSTETNRRFLEQLKRWHQIFGEKMLLYTYDVNFYNYLINFNNFGSYKSHIEDYANNGIKYYYSQGPVSCNVTGLTHMRIYVESQLIWDIRQNYDDLAYDFIANYYKDAGDYMKMYYDITRARYAYFTSAIDPNQGGIYGRIGGSDLWDFSTVNSLNICLNNAINSIKKYEMSNPDMYSKLYYRIKREAITVLFLLINNFSSFYSSTALADMIDEFDTLCAYFNIVKTFEGGQGLPF